MTKNLLSFVIPVKDEDQTIRVLFDRIAEQVAILGRALEVIFIDDGSLDGSWAVIKALAAEHPGEVVALRFRRNFGKADALAVGFENARGEIVFTLDADLQDDPAEIPRFIEKLNEGFDIVSGWKKDRHDPWHKVLPSRVFNAMLSWVSGVRLHDHNCGFKCYRSEVVKSLSLYGEMHRMIPALGSIKGYRSGEIVVQHFPRVHGRSKYGFKRFLRGFMDMHTVYFLKHFRDRPLHFFGSLSLLCVPLAAVLLLLGSVPGVAAPLAALLTLFGEGCAAGILPLLALGFLAEADLHSLVQKDRRPTIAEMIRDLPPAYLFSSNNIVALPGPVPAKLGSDAPLVLVADDSPQVREIMRGHLESAGWQVEEAADGNEAIAKLKTETSVVLLDLEMPGKSGLECLSYIKRYHADVKIIIVSGNDEIATAVTAMKLGAFDYVTKPFGAVQLIDSVQKALKTRTLIAELA